MGGALELAVQKYDVNVIGITLSKAQSEFARERLASWIPTARSEVRLQGWEEFDEPVDRIVSIGAFEAFKVERYPLFFDKAYKLLLPDGGRMLLHTILAHTQKFFRDNGIKVTISDLKFMQFIEAEIFPGGRLPAVEDIEQLAADSASCSSASTCSASTMPAPWTCGRPTCWPPATRRRSRSPTRGVRALHEIPDRLRGLLPPRHHQHRSVHLVKP